MKETKIFPRGLYKGFLNKVIRSVQSDCGAEEIK